MIERAGNNPGQEDENLTGYIDNIDNLAIGKFEEVLEKKECMRLYSFILTEASAVGRFLVALPLEEGGHVWFSYKISSKRKLINKSKRNLEISTSGVYPPASEDGPTIDPPEKLKDLPTWYLTKDQLKLEH